MAHVAGSVLIARPAETVFDTVADERHEPRYNAAMVSAEKITDGPIGRGTKFAAAIRSGHRIVPMTTEFTEYDRPRKIGSRSVVMGMEIDGAVEFASEPGGTRMRWSWNIRPKGVMRFATPVIAAIGRRQERRIWNGLKRLLEGDALDGGEEAEG